MRYAHLSMRYHGAFDASWQSTGPDRGRSCGELFSLRVYVNCPCTLIVPCVARARPLCVGVRWAISATDRWAALGIEPRTSRTQRVNHTTKPSSQLQTLQVCWVPDVAASTAVVEALSRKAEHCELDNSVVVTRKKLSTMIRQQGRFFGSRTAFQMGCGVPRAIPCAYEVHVLAWHHTVREVSMGEKMGVRGTKKVGNMCCLPAQFSTCCTLCS